MGSGFDRPENIGFDNRRPLPLGVDSLLPGADGVLNRAEELSGFGSLLLSGCGSRLMEPSQPGQALRPEDMYPRDISLDSGCLFCQPKRGKSVHGVGCSHGSLE